MSERYYGIQTRRYGIVHDGHDVELEFDKRLLVLNQARLSVDGLVVDSARIVYGERELTAALPDGRVVVVQVDSGMVGELTRAQLRRADGSWLDLRERQSAS